MFRVYSILLLMFACGILIWWFGYCGCLGVYLWIMFVCLFDIVLLLLMLALFVDLLIVW